MAVRDRTRYRQELTVERFSLPSDKSRPATDEDSNSLQKIGERTTAVEVAPSLTPDAQGRFEVLVRVVADTDDHGRPKANVDPKSQPGLLVEVLWDELFFPLLEEKLPFLSFEPLESADPSLTSFRFEPKTRTQTIILASGIVFIDKNSGGIKEIRIDSLYNLRTLNKQLGKLDSITADIKFAPFHEVWNLPASAAGTGVSHLPHLEGFFRFKFQETGYEAVMKIPEP